MKKTILLLTFLLSYQAFSCTTFTISDNSGSIVFGRNFDFPVGMGHIHLNYSNMQKTALIPPPETPLTWTSKYGSITFNQTGREFPYGGMNEAGLVIEQMWLQEAEYPEPDNRFALNMMQWIQYQLDNAATVQQVIDSDTLVRISKSSQAPLHFLISDAENNTAAIEFMKGRMIVHQGSSLPHRVLANCTYDHSLAYKASVDKKENKEHNAWTRNSSGRFAKAASLIEDCQNPDLIEYSFMILDSVAQQHGTQWSIVYDISNRKVHYKTAINPMVQTIDMQEQDFSCGSGFPYVSLADTLQDTGSFRSLTVDENLKMIESMVEGVEFLKNSVTPEMNAVKAGYMKSVHCVQPN